MKTLHVNYVDDSGRVYCHRLAEIVSLNSRHFQAHCFKCPYFVDTASNNGGVECEFDDASKEEWIEFIDSAESEKHSAYQYVRLGMKTKLEVDATLKGYGAEESSEEQLYPEEPEDSDKEKK
jgi:hypothetical protein